jgi:hypothetical protein
VPLQGVKLSKLCIYFDTDCPRMSPANGAWEKMDREAWDALLLPSNHAGASAPGVAHPHVKLATSVTALLGGAGGAGAAAGGGAGASMDGGVEVEAGGGGGGDGATDAAAAAAARPPDEGGGSENDGAAVGSGGPAGGKAKPAAGATAVAAADAKPPARPALEQEVATDMSGLLRHQFLLNPVDGTMRYTRRTAAARLLDSDAAQEIELKLHSISVRLNRMQYVSAQKLLEEFDRYTAGAPHRYLRPTCRPTNGGGPRGGGWMGKGVGSMALSPA